MLAYVFWHWPRPGINLDAYEANLRTFHQTLAANKPAGFQNSTVFSTSGSNWLGTQGPVFEDWYLMDDSAALDHVNEGAVTGACEQPHNVVARDAAGGTAGLYRLRQGTAELSNKCVAVWFSKPDGVSYRDFFARISKESLTGVALWQRQLTLGPTREFCLLSEDEDIVESVVGQRISLQLVWGS